MKGEKPLRAVRRKCLNCCCGQALEVKLCPVTVCPLWPYRLGEYPADHQGAKSVLRPIHLKCLDCGPETCKREDGKVKADWQVCRFRTCPLWPYRFGKNPVLKGRRVSNLPPRKPTRPLMEAGFSG